MALSMPNGKKQPTLGLVTLPVIVVGHMHCVSGYVVKQLPMDLILGLPAMCKMGAIIDTANLSIIFRTDPHCSLRISVEGGANKEVYIVLVDTKLPALTQSLVLVEVKPLSLSEEIVRGVWRDVVPYLVTEY